MAFHKALEHPTFGPCELVQHIIAIRWKTRLSIHVIQDKLKNHALMLAHEVPEVGEPAREGVRDPRHVHVNQSQTLTWATSKKTQLANLESKVGGGTPTRESVYKLPEVEKAKQPPSKMPNILTADAVFEAWKPENIGLRPKIAAWNECDTAIFTQLSKMLAGQQGPEKCMTNSKDGFVQAIDNAASLRNA